MSTEALYARVLADEALTRGLADPEARLLVEWLVARAEELEEESAPGAAEEVRRLCRRGRSISRFVILWCHRNDRGAAGQLAAAERFAWPLPATDLDPCDLMEQILEWEFAQDTEPLPFRR